VKKVVVLSLALLSTSCLTTPGIEEPSLEVCTLISKTIIECEKDGVLRDIHVLTAIGYKMISPVDFVKIDNHHQALHHELNTCKSEASSQGNDLVNIPDDLIK